MTEPKKEPDDQNEASSTPNSGVSREEEALIEGEAHDETGSSRIEVDCSELEKGREAESLESHDNHDECKTSSGESARSNSDKSDLRYETEKERLSIDTCTDPQVSTEKDVTNHIQMPHLRDDFDNRRDENVTDLPDNPISSSNRNIDKDVKMDNVSADVVESASSSEKLDHVICIDDTSEMNARKENPGTNSPERAPPNSFVMNIRSDNQNQVSAVRQSFQTPKKSDVIQTMTSGGRRHTFIYPQKAMRPKRHSSDTKKKILYCAKKEENSSTSRGDDSLSKFIAMKHQKALCTPPPTGSNSDLLSSFITYKDQIPSIPPTQNLSLQDENHTSLSKGRRPFTAPSKLHMNIHVEKRPPGLEKRKSVGNSTGSKGPTREPLKSLDLCKSYDQEDYEIPPHSIKQSNNLSSSKTSESHRVDADTKRHESGPNRALSIHKEKDETRFSRPAHNNQISRWSEVQRIITSALGSAVKFLCLLCIIARCLTFSGAKRSLLYYIVESPAVWLVRFYILVFHAVIVSVEMKISIPGILPRGTLNNFVHRAFIQSFVGLLDICFNSNKRLVERVSDGTSNNETEMWIDISNAVLRVAPIGLIACAISYFMLAVCGIDGRSNFNRRPTIIEAPTDLNV